MFVTEPAGGMRRQWMSELNGTGSGSVAFPPGAVGVPALGDYVTCSVAGVAHAVFVAEKRSTVIVGEPWDLGSVTVTGRGPMALLENAIVAPFVAAGGDPRAACLASDRVFHWASADSPDHDLGVTWATPAAVAWADDTTARAGYPDGWDLVDVDGAAAWIWSTDPTLPAPNGAANWFRYVFGTAGPMRVWFTADDACDLYLDGRSIASFGVQEAGSDGWMSSHTVDIDPGAGSHVLAAKVTNRADMGTVDNPAGFLLVAKLVDPELPEADWTVAIASDITWDVADEEPSWALADIWATLMAEAAVRGAGPLPAVSFASAKRVSRSWQVGTSMADVLQDCISLGCTAWTDPTGIVHVADAPPGGTASTTGILSATLTESSIGPTRALVRHDDGAVWEGTGSAETYVEVGGSDSDAAASAQGSWMLDAAAPRTVLDVGQVAALAIPPQPGQVITIGTVTATLLSVSVEEDESGLATWTPEAVVEATP